MTDFLVQLRLEPALAGLNLTPCEDPEERQKIAAELNVVVAHELYGLTRNELRYLLDPRDILGSESSVETFAALRRAEERQFGEYRTARLILTAFDHLTLLSTNPRTYTSDPTAPLVPEYSPLGIIRNETDARLAGLILAIIQQAKELPREQMTLALTALQMTGTASTVAQSEADRLAAFCHSHPTVLPVISERLQPILRLFEAVGTIRIQQQGALIEAIADAPLPSGVIVESDAQAIAGILLGIARAGLERQATEALGTTSQSATKQA
jgi:plasmid stabilization system protein ParE